MKRRKNKAMGIFSLHSVFPYNSCGGSTCCRGYMGKYQICKHARGRNSVMGIVVDFGIGGMK